MSKRRTVVRSSPLIQAAVRIERDHLRQLEARAHPKPRTHAIRAAIRQYLAPMQFSVTLTATIGIRHHLPDDGTRAARATVPHEHTWQIRATWPSDEAGTTDLDAHQRRLSDFALAWSLANLNDHTETPTTEWFAAMALRELQASEVTVEDEERRLVRCLR